MPKAIAKFDVTKWDDKPYDEPDDGPRLSQVVVHKQFTGDLQGTSSAQVLMCQADATDYLLGAGYIASEKVTGALHQREGSFVIQHGGLSGGGTDPYTFGQIVPGSGTGDLAGISGTATIARDDDNNHTLVLDYEMASDQ